MSLYPYIVFIPSVVGLHHSFQLRGSLELETTAVSSPASSSTAIAAAEDAYNVGESMTLKEQFMLFGVHHALVTPDECDDYLSTFGCSWTATWSCPNQPLGANYSGIAMQDGSLGYHCCCDVGLWDDSNALQGTLATLTVKAQACADLGVNATHCEWTNEWACQGQYKGSKYRDDAGGQIDMAYTCCCVLGYWRKSVKRDLRNFHDRLKHEATCGAHLDQHGCSWASQSRCADIPRAQVLIANLTEDARPNAYTCCCGQQLWKKETEHCDAYLSSKGCQWTEEYNCPDQPKLPQTRESVAPDDSIGYDCCCDRGLWKRWFKMTQNFSKPMFIHIPKNAGSAIEEASANTGILYPKKWQHFRNVIDMPDGSMCEKYHVPPSYLRASGEPDEDAEIFDVPGSFCVVRHPYDRAVSEYLYMLTVPWGVPMANTYRTKLIEKPKCTQQGLNTFLQSVLHKVKDGRKYLHDCHFLPQTEYVYGRDGKQWCNNILRHDNFPDVFNKFMEAWRLPTRLSNIRDNNTTAVCDGNITVNNLSRETKNMINEIYINDFGRLGYNMW